MQVIQVHSGTQDLSELVKGTSGRTSTLAAAAARALDLDDGLAEAHAALGAEKGAFEYDWQGARFQFKRAIELNSNSAQAHFQLSISP